MTPTHLRLAAPLAVLALIAGCSKEEDPAPAKLSLSATALSFSAKAGANAAKVGDTVPSPQTVTITNAGEGTLAKPTISLAYVTGAAGWLTATVSGDAAPFTLTATPSTAIGDGIHTATIQLASAGASNTPATVTVTYAVAPNAEPVIALSVSALQFTAEVGDAAVPPQALYVTNGGGLTLADPTVDAIDYGAGPAGWLDVVVSGADITVTALTTGLARGRYTATVTVGSLGAWNTPVVVPVTFDVTHPALAVSPASLAFQMTAGSSPAFKTITVVNSADGTLEVPTVTDNQAWLGATVTGSAAPFTVTVSISGTYLAVGTYSGTLTIDSANASNGPISVPVTLTVVAGQLGTVSCYNPANSVCEQLTSNDATERSDFTATCAEKGFSATCPSANRLGPCTGVGGYTSDAFRVTHWYYTPAFTPESAQQFCAFLSGTWEG